MPQPVFRYDRRHCTNNCQYLEAHETCQLVHSSRIQAMRHDRTQVVRIPSGRSTLHCCFLLCTGIGNPLLCSFGCALRLQGVRRHRQLRCSWLAALRLHRAAGQIRLYDGLRTLQCQAAMRLCLKADCVKGFEQCIPASPKSVSGTL